MDEHEKNIAIGEFVAKIVILVVVWFFVATALGIGLDMMGDEHGDPQAKAVATVLVIWLFFQIDRWAAKR